MKKAKIRVALPPGDKPLARMRWAGEMEREQAARDNTAGRTQLQSMNDRLLSTQRERKNKGKLALKSYKMVEDS